MYVTCNVGLAIMMLMPSSECTKYFTRPTMYVTYYSLLIRLPIRMLFLQMGIEVGGCAIHISIHILADFAFILSFTFYFLQ